MKQYTNFRKKQGEEISQKTKTLQSLNKALLEQKAQKEALVMENREAQKELQQERRSQQRLIRGLKSKSRSLAIEVKQKQRRRLRLIR